MSHHDDSRRDPELQDFLERFRLASPTQIDDLAGQVTASTPEPETAARRSRAGIEPLVDWLDYPPNITFDPTGRCNVVCEMCDFHKVRSEKGWKLRQMPELAPEVL